MTIDDPGAYSEPWTIAWDINWSEGQELADYICQENNQYLIDLLDDFGNPFFESTNFARWDLDISNRDRSIYLFPLKKAKSISIFVIDI